MKDYYKILEVSRHSTAEEIKRSYRRLALQYHPDKNPSPSALIFIQEINEAYDVLGDENKRNRYNTRYDYKGSPPPAKVKKERPYTYRSRVFVREKPVYNFRVWAYKAKFLSGIILLFCGFTILDYLIPVRYDTIYAEKVEYRVTRLDRLQSDTLYRVHSGADYFEINVGKGLIDHGDTLHIKESFLFNTIKEIRNGTTAKGEELEINTIYGDPFILILFGFTIALGAFLVPSQELSLLLSIASGIIFVIFILCI